jgi:hypothetical protein
MFNCVPNVTPFGIYPYHQSLSQSRLRDSQLFDHYNDAQKNQWQSFSLAVPSMLQGVAVR